MREESQIIAVVVEVARGVGDRDRASVACRAAGCDDDARTTQLGTDRAPGNRRIGITAGEHTTDKAAAAKTIRSGRDVDVVRIQQQDAGAAGRRTQIHRAARVEVEEVLTRHLGKTAIALVAATARFDQPDEVRRFIRPHDHLAAVAGQFGICFENCVLANIGQLGVLHFRVLALKITTGEDHAAASVTRRIHRRCAVQHDGRAEDLYRTTLAGTVSGGGCWRSSDRRLARTNGFRSGVDSDIAQQCAYAIGASSRCGGDRDGVFFRERAAGLTLWQVDVEPGCRRTNRFDTALDRNCAGLGLYRDGACSWPARFRPAACFERDVLLGLEHDLALRVDFRRAGRNDATVADVAGEHADRAAAGDQLAEVDRFVAAGGDLDPQVRTFRVDDFNRVAGGEDDFAFRGVDDAAVFDILADEVDEAAALRDDGAGVADVAAAGRIEHQAAGQQVRIADAEAGGDEACGVDVGAGADGDAVRVDQEYFAVRDHVAEDRRGGAAGDPVEYHRRCALLYKLHRVA